MDDPALTDREFMTSDRYVQQFDRSVEFLNQVKRTKHVQYGISSYSWKHVAENWHRRKNVDPDGDYYISSGMFIAAAISMGFLIKKTDSPNVMLNISKRSDKV
jgi:hypothetical protein